MTTDATPTAGQGRCLCGAVRFAFDTPSKWVAHCHCSLCRRAHGAAFATWIGVPRSAFRFVAGQADLTSYASTPGAKRSFCRHCGSSLLFESPRWPGEVHVAAALVEGALDRAPEAHVFFDDRVPWLDVADELPRRGGKTGTEPLAAPASRGPGKRAIVNGDPPEIVGMPCEELLVQQYWSEGELVEEANVVHMRFDGEWYRLYFEHAQIFWRLDHRAPELASAEATILAEDPGEDELAFRLVDVARQWRFRGDTLLAYDGESVENGARVWFQFAGGTRLAFQCIGDHTTYRVDVAPVRS